MRTNNVNRSLLAKNDGATIGRGGCGTAYAVYCRGGAYVESVGVLGVCLITTKPVGMGKGAAVRLCHEARRVGVMGWVVGGVME